jgi:hypothetical protein
MIVEKAQCALGVESWKASRGYFACITPYTYQKIRNSVPSAPCSKAM